MATSGGKKSIKNSSIVLPGEHYIFQSNRVTNARFPDFNIYHAKVFVCLINQLQSAIQADMNGLQWQQLGLFEELDPHTLKVGIQLNEITSPDNYSDVIACFSLFEDIKMKIPSPYTKDYILHTRLFEKIEQPKKFGKNPTVFVHLQKQVANDLISVAKSADTNKPIKFTRFLYNVVMNSKNKYTWKIYTLISSWKVKGGFFMTLEEFRFVLGLSDNEYANYADLKKRVILPAQKELYNKADCWFNCAEKDFEIKEGKKVTGLRFKIITPAASKVVELKMEQIRNLLRMSLGFKEADFEAISGIFKDTTDYEAVVNKILDLIEYIKLNKSTIALPVKYAISSLSKQFL